MLAAPAIVRRKSRLFRMIPKLTISRLGSNDLFVNIFFVGNSLIWLNWLDKVAISSLTQRWICRIQSRVAGPQLDVTPSTHSK